MVESVTNIFANMSIRSTPTVPYQTIIRKEIQLASMKKKVKMKFLHIIWHTLILPSLWLD